VHNGLKKQKLNINGKFRVSNSSVFIEDALSGDHPQFNLASLTLHFHPDVKLEISENDIFANNIRIKLEGFRSFAIESYEYACGFNSLKGAKKLVLKPSETNRIEIHYAD
jgi:hypothetical protein